MSPFDYHKQDIRVRKGNVAGGGFWCYVCDGCLFGGSYHSISCLWTISYALTTTFIPLYSHIRRVKDRSGFPDGKYCALCGGHIHSRDFRGACSGISSNAGSTKLHRAVGHLCVPQQDHFTNDGLPASILVL